MNKTANRPKSFKDLKCIDIGIIKGIGWAEAMFETLNDGFKKSFLNWISVVFNLSLNEEHVKELISLFILHFEDRCCELVSNIQNLRKQVIFGINESLKRIQVLCESLQIEMPAFEQQKLGLFQEKLLITRHVSELEKMVEARLTALKELDCKQLKLCKSLGKEAKIIPDNPLPSCEVLSDFNYYIEQLEEEKFEREEAFFNIKEKLTLIVEDLEYIPNNAFENQVIQTEKDFAVTDTNMQCLENFLNKLLKEQLSVKQRIGQLRQQIEELWTFLDVEVVEREEFREKCTKNSYRTLEAMKNKLQRCIESKKIKVLIDRLRQELVKLWDQCLVSQPIRDKFTSFHSNCYTEDLVELHEIELSKWKLIGEKNRDLLNLISEHGSLWQKLTELEESKNAPGRFNNRGGQLLKEEKERNSIKKKISKIEENLQEMADKYLASRGEDFLLNGLTVNEHIKNLYAEKENEKKSKFGARKAQREVTLLKPSVHVSTSNRKLDGQATIVKITKPVPRKIVTDPRRRSKCFAPKKYSKQSSTISQSKEKGKNCPNSFYVQFQIGPRGRKLFPADDF